MISAAMRMSGSVAHAEHLSMVKAHLIRVRVHAVSHREKNNNGGNGKKQKRSVGFMAILTLTLTVVKTFDNCPPVSGVQSPAVISR